MAQRTKLKWKDHPVKTGRKGEDLGVGAVQTVRMEKKQQSTAYEARKEEEEDLRMMRMGR